MIKSKIFRKKFPVIILGICMVSVCLFSSMLLNVGTVSADSTTSNHALRIVQQYQGVFTAPPSVTNTDQTTDAPLLGNGDVGVAILNKIDTMTFILHKNEFWSLNDKGVRTMARMSLAISGMAGASYSMTQNIATGEVNGTFVMATEDMATAWARPEMFCISM